MENNITNLKQRLNVLQKENEILKKLLEKAGIDYRKELLCLHKNNVEKLDLNQGNCIIFPEVISNQMANQFFAYFWGRTDVYAKRIESKSGRVGYYPQCVNFWNDFCEKKINTKFKCSDCKYQKYKALTIDIIISHLLGKNIIGIYPLHKDNTCRFLAFDFDYHDQDKSADYLNTHDDWMEEVNAMRKICTLNGVEPLVERSRSGNGAHIWIFFEKPILASLVRKFGMSLLEKGAQQVNLKSFAYYDRMLPAQDILPKKGFGNLIALPLQGQALKNGNTAFIDKNWNAYKNQWEALWKTPRLSQSFIEEKIKEWNGNFDEKPWETVECFNKSELNGQMHITLANGIYVSTLNLGVSIQNKIRKLARFSNPVFYKNQGMGISTYNLSRYIYMGKDYNSGYIQIPRGCYDTLMEYAKKGNIEVEIDDKRQAGKSIHVEFQGKLRDEQKMALDKLLQEENGILLATTAFGKTVVCASLIAKRKINTLIIIENSSLLKQWKDRLNEFLSIQEEYPEYTTPKGRVKKRTSLIGSLQGSKDTMTGIIDVAMAGSLCKKGEFHKLLNTYGMIIVDECHHAASDTEANILKEVRAKYVYGVSAIHRTDKLDRKNTMLLGPVLYKYTAKEQAEEQGIERFVYPRFTNTVIPRGMMKDPKNPNEAYEIIRNNDLRDKMIIQDIKDCVQKKRTPIVLSKYVDHCEKLFKDLKDVADHIFLLVGKNGRKENDEIIKRMETTPEDESLILIATGSLVGEGFDFSRLDTLVLATPVSSDSVVSQYIGRIHRNYEGRKDVIVYDYVDVHIPMFDKMYGKRLKTYKSSGYQIMNEVAIQKQKANSIFDGENYIKTFQKDLLQANKNIVISSPSITGNKVSELIELLKEKQQNGVEVTILTWQPDVIKYGSANYKMQLIEEMREAGFYSKTKEEIYEQFAIIDQEIVWYGNINLLGKADVEDNMMRIENKQVANELMELTFS